MNDFSILRTRGAPIDLWLHAVEDFDALRYALGHVPDSPAVVFQKDRGRYPADLIGTTHGILRVVSLRFVTALAEAGCTGWRTYPVVIEAVPSPEYFILGVTGRSGPVLRERAERRIMPPPVEGGRGYVAHVGLVVDEESWDGSDVFSPEGTVIVCLTRKAKKALEAADVSGASFLSSTEYRLPG